VKTGLRVRANVYEDKNGVLNKHNRALTDVLQLSCKLIASPAGSSDRLKLVSFRDTLLPQGSLNGRCAFVHVSSLIAHDSNPAFNR
jgi:hypothetical protein